MESVLYTFQFSIEGLAAWLESKFGAEDAPFNKIYEVPNPPLTTTNIMAKVKGLEITENGYTVILLDLNFLLEIKQVGFRTWLASCQVFYTSYYMDGKRVLEFRRNNGQDDVTVAFAVDNKLVSIEDPVVE